jgi:hypothetical protein
MAPPASFEEAESALLERRRAQRGFLTLGDEADRALLAALAVLPPTSGSDARGTGQRLGREVYSRRFVEDTLPQGLAALSLALHESGVGSLCLGSTFHRSASVRFEPQTGLAGANVLVLSAFVEGVLEGFLSCALNCQARAWADSPLALHVELGAGREVSGRGTA